MRRWWTAWLIALILALGLRAEAVDRYVSPGGSGTTCSQGSPCAFQEGLNQTNGGDTLICTSGTYTGRYNTSNNCGGSTCTIRSEPQHACLLQGDANTDQNDTGLDIDHSGYIIDGLRFDQHYTGLEISHSGEQTVVRNVIVYLYSKTGINVDGATGPLIEDTVVARNRYDNAVINDGNRFMSAVRWNNTSNGTLRNSILYGATTQGLTGAFEDDGYVILVLNNSNNNTLQGNLLMESSKEQMRFFADSGSSLSGNTVRDNIFGFAGKGRGIMFENENCEPNTLINNIFWGNHQSTETKGCNSSPGNTFEHGTYIGTDESVSTMQLTSVSGRLSHQTVIKNNLFYHQHANTSTSYLLTVVNFGTSVNSGASGWNLWWRPGSENWLNPGCCSGTAQYMQNDIHSPSSQPQFVNLSVGDITLASGSPGKGNSSGGVDRGATFNQFLRKDWMARITTEMPVTEAATSGTSHNLPVTNGLYQVFVRVPGSTNSNTNNFTIEGFNLSRDYDWFVNQNDWGNCRICNSPIRWLYVGFHQVSDGTLNMSWQGSNSVDRVRARRFPSPETAFTWLGVAPPPPPPAGDGVFVDDNGSGSACSQASPCSLSTGLGQAGSGDTIFFNDGTYGDFSTQSSGVTLKAINQHQATISTSNIFAISVQHDDITVDGLHVTGGCTTPGQSCGGGSGHALVRIRANDFVIRNSLVEDSADTLINFCGTITSNCSGLLIEDNIFRDSGFNPPGVGGEGIYICEFSGQNICTDVTIRRNLIQDVGCEQALDVKPGGRNVVATLNTFENQALKSGNGCSNGVDGVVVSQGELEFTWNIVRNNNLSGGSNSVFRLASNPGSVANNVVYNNTHGGNFIRPREGSSQVSINNNAFCSNSNTNISGSFTVFDNLFGTGTPDPDCRDKENAILAMLGQNPTLPPGDITTGLIAYWPLENNLLDAVGTSHLTHSGTPTYVSGQIGQALSLNGIEFATTEKHSIGNVSLFATASQQWSVLAWVNTTSTGTIVASAVQTQADRDFQTAVSSTGQFDIHARGVLTKSIATVNNGAWRHVAVTWDGQTLRYFIDSTVEIGTAGVGSSPEDLTEHIVLGARSLGQGFRLTGSLDDVRIYNRSLSHADVNSAFQFTGGATPPAAPTGLIITSLTSTTISLEWDGVAQAVMYHLERCSGVSCTGFAEIDTISDTQFVDTGLTPGTTYRYRVRARNAQNLFSDYSSIQSVTTSSEASLFGRVTIGGRYIGGRFR